MVKESRRAGALPGDDPQPRADMTATRSLSASVQHFGRTLLAADAGCPDAELARRFAERRDEAAFAALVHRHGAAVFGVCRRVLSHQQDAEDAFRATFLVLARNAGSVRRAGAVGNWLYGVTYNVARKARATRFRREVKKRQAARRPKVTVVLNGETVQDVDLKKYGVERGDGAGDLVPAEDHVAGEQAAALERLQVGPAPRSAAVGVMSCSVSAAGP